MMLAQGGPSWLDGSVEVPFWVVALVVGAALCAGLFYFARRASGDRRAEQAERERGEG